MGLIALFFGLVFTLNGIAAWQGPRADETFFSNLAVSIPAVGAAIAAAVGFFIGVVSIWQQKERSVFVYLAVLIGLLVLIFVLGEILTPHE